MKNIDNMPEVAEHLQKFIIWNESNRGHSEKLFVGSWEECNVEFEAQGYSAHNECISQNRIIDQWENGVTGEGFALFANGVTISYSL